MTKPSGFLRSSLFLLIIASAFSAGFGACAQNSAMPPTATKVDGARARALEAVAHRGSLAVEADGVVFSRTQAGAVRGEPIKSGAIIPADDVAIEAELRGRVATDTTMAARDVDIDVDKGVVRLCGTVPDSTHAAHLFDLALALPGVKAVESSLAWVSRTDAQGAGHLPAAAAVVTPRTVSTPRAAR